MINLTNISRRLFLSILVCLGAFDLSLLTRALTKYDEHYFSDQLALIMAEFFSFKDSAAVVGREYLGSAPNEADASLLVDLICAHRAGGRESLIGVDKVEMQEWLRQQQQLDFERGHVVKVKGWILSVTEARLSALAALV